MPAYLPIPEGLQVPEGETFDLMTTYTLDEGQLYPVAVDGIPFPDVEAPESKDVAKKEMATGKEMPEEMPEGGGFMAAIESAMGKGKR